MITSIYYFEISINIFNFSASKKHFDAQFNFIEKQKVRKCYKTFVWSCYGLLQIAYTSPSFWSYKLNLGIIKFYHIILFRKYKWETHICATESGWPFMHSDSIYPVRSNIIYYLKDKNKDLEKHFLKVQKDF